MSDFDLSQYSPYSPQFTKLTLPNAGQRVAEGPTTPAKAPLPLAFKNATMPPADPTPAPQSPAVAIAKLDNATGGTTTDFSHDAFEEADLLSITSTKKPDKPSKIQTYNQKGIIGIIGGLFGGGDKKTDAPTENEPPTRSHAPTSEELELPTATKKAPPQEAPQEAPTSPPDTGTSGTGASNLGIQPKQTPQNTRGEVSMNTVDGRPDPDFDRKLAAAEAQKKATQNGEEVTDQGALDEINEQMDAMSGTPDQQKAYLKAHGQDPDAPKVVQGFNGPVEISNKKPTVVQGFNGPVEISNKKPTVVQGFNGPVTSEQKPSVDGLAGTVTPGAKQAAIAPAEEDPFAAAADKSTGVINNNDPGVIKYQQDMNARAAARAEQDYGPGHNPNDLPKKEGGFFNKLFG